MFRRSFRHVLIALLFALMAGIVAQGSQLPTAQAHGGHDHAADLPSGAPVTLAAGSDPKTASADWWQGSDLLITGRSHPDGYTVYIAQEKEKYVLRPLATIRPAGYYEDDWLGYTCLTGDRRFAVATLMPRWAVNTPRLRDRGGLAYVVSTANGKIWPLANEVAFKYHAMNCGAGSKVALMRNLGEDQQSSEVLVADAGTRRVASLGVVKQQLTSPVPDGDAAVALGQGGILALQPGGKTSLRAKVVSGVPYRLVARGARQTVAVLRGATVEAYAVDKARLSLVATGPKTDAQIFSSDSEKPAFSGLQHTTKSAVTSRTVIKPRLAAADGPGVIPRDLAIDAVSAEGKVVLATTTVGSLAHRTVASGESDSEATQAVPQAEEKRLFSASTGRLLAGRFPSESATSVTEAVPPTVTKARQFAPAGNFTTPKCGVPRNEPTRTAYGANDVQVRWAVEQASRNMLPARPADYLKSGLPSYNPSSDFALPPIKPAGGNVPPALFNGVLAQESAYRQASRRTLPGSGGNSVIGNYYGAGGTLDVIDYTKADCGYGISQVTSGMAASETSITPNGKAKIAIDYAENIQAGMNILVKKWNQLQEAGIRFNDSQPMAIDNWYLALWAYNSGVQPGAQYGNTTGCTPSPTCTDEFGNWGLGWANNPRNPDYPPTRSVFLRLTYADAEHPADWPYQERVIGWAETPIKNYKGQDAYEAADQGDYPYPPAATFCTAANSCDPATTAACTRSDYRCWWHLPVNVKTCNPVNLCTTSPFVTPSGAPEPTAPNPWVPACNSDLGSKAVIVDELADPSKNIFCPSRNWSNAGTFTYEVGKDAAGAPLGIIDFHQSSVGLGGHIFFTGNRVASDTAHKVTGRWKPTNLPLGSYVVKAHIPRAGASVGSAVYKVTTANGTVSEKVINQHEHFNHWKTLGAFQLGPNAQVELSNVTKNDVIGGAGTVAFDAIAFVPAVGTVVEKKLGAYAYFEPDTNIQTAAPTSWMAGPMAGPDALYQWGSTRGPELARQGGAATKAMGTRWSEENLAAYNSPDADDDGISPATILGLPNQLALRPKTSSQPAWFDSDTADAFKIRTTAVVSYVLGADGKIIEGSADVDYSQRAGNTYLPKLIPEFFAAVTQDYRISTPDLSYATTNLNTYDHQIRQVTPATSHFPARAYKPAGKAPVLSLGSENCIDALYTSGGVDGFRPMIGVGYVSARVESWRNQIRARTDIPLPVKTMASEIYDIWFDTGPADGTPPSGSIFNQAPPIWQELNFTVCGNGQIRTDTGQPVLRASWMTDQYLYFAGQAIDVDGRPRASAEPLMRGDFFKFSKVPGSSDTPFGPCDWNTGRSGNPWALTAVWPFSDPAGVNPEEVHFCRNKFESPDPEPGG